jgi:hypothetical protein
MRKLLFSYFLLHDGGRKTLHEDIENGFFEWVILLENKKIEIYCFISCKLIKQIDFCLLQQGFHFSI